MLCRLLLMRHAKSASSSEANADHERPLDAQGRNDAPQIAAKMLKLGFAPQLVLCSDSKRTMETWELLASHLDPVTPVVESARLYESDADTYVDEIAGQNFEGHTLLLIGHNPVIETCIRFFTNETVNMRPSDAAILEIHSDSWKKALTQSGLWKLVNVISC